MSMHLEILRRARMEDLLDTAASRRQQQGDGTRLGRPPSRDQWQQLAYHLFLRRPESGSYAIGLASATAGEGTSYVAHHLAAQVARSGGRDTVLVEANLHRPSQAARHGVEPDPGLRRLLTDRGFPLESCWRQTAAAHLWVIPAGGGGVWAEDPDWSLLLPVLGRLRERFRALVVDLPPVNLTADATLIAGWLDGLVLVVEADLCSREVIQNAAARLRRANPRLLGTVLNKRKFVVPEAVYRRL